MTDPTTERLQTELEFTRAELADANAKLTNARVKLADATAERNAYRAEKDTYFDALFKLTNRSLFGPNAADEMTRIAQEALEAADAARGK